MNNTLISDIQKPDVPKRIPLFVKNNQNNIVSENVKKTAALFEENQTSDKESNSTDKEKEKSAISSIKTSPGKLKHNLQINVGALMPGAARPKIRPPLAKSTSTDETDQSAASIAGLPLVSRVARPKSAIFGDKEVAAALSDAEKFESLAHTEVLTSATKDRARIPVKRRPSTRKARQEAVRKSMTDFSLYQNEQNALLPEEDDSKSQAFHSGDVKNSFLNDLTKKLSIPDYVPKDETSKHDDSPRKGEDTPEVKGISLVFDGNKTEKPVKNEERVDDKTEKSVKDDDVVKKSVSKDLFDSFDKSKTEKSEENEELGKKSVSKGLFDSSLEEDDNFFLSDSKIKPTSEFLNSVDVLKQEQTDPSSLSTSDVTSRGSTSLQTESVKKKEKTSIFGDGNSSSDEDLRQPLKTEQPTTTKDLKPSIFSDISDSDGESDLFGAKPKVSSGLSKKIVGETSKKASIFDDSAESDEDDLFGSKTSSSKSETTGSLLVTRRVESKTVKLAGVKKLENKEVTDFDPLSGFK